LNLSSIKYVLCALRGNREGEKQVHLSKSQIDRTSILIDDYRRCWALRYLRESTADLSLARKSRILETVRNLSAISMRKAQLAISYALGEPEYLDAVVTEALMNRTYIHEPLLRLVARIRVAIENISHSQSPLNKDEIIKITEAVVDASSSIVEAIINKSVQD
jgi:hypothetical protein